RSPRSRGGRRARPRDRADRATRRAAGAAVVGRRPAARGAGALAVALTALLAAPLALELRVRRAARPPTKAWWAVPIEPHGKTRLGLSFRPRQAEAFGLAPLAALDELLTRPFEVLRLGAYWSRIEPRP